MRNRKPEGNPSKLPNQLPMVRCAIYTRKSTEEGLEQEFNSLDAQREASEAYIASQRHEGWQLIPDRYDDGGFTGGNTERPALQRLFRDIETGKIDCVVVYKVDRLSRSLLDFGRMMDLFDKNHISFVSVTQQFNTSNSMGRLMLNVLLSFAQFEREIIAERTRDKMSAMRRKGKWVGGLPPLGYDRDPETSKLMINPDEASQVRAIFELYSQERGLLPVVQKLKERRWHNKATTTIKGSRRGGKPFTRTSLYRLLTNVTYTGRVRYRDEIHPGEHPSLIDDELFMSVQRGLRENNRSGGAKVRNRFGAFLKGILRCGCCDCSMTPSHTVKKNKRYRYYICQKAMKNGYDTCPSKNISAEVIEQFVVDRIRCIGRDSGLLEQTVAQAQEQVEKKLTELESERRLLERERDQIRAEVRKYSGRLNDPDNRAVLGQLASLQSRLEQTEQRLDKVMAQREEQKQQSIRPHDVKQALEQFDEVWEALNPKDQARLIELLIERVEYDGRDGSVLLTFHPTGIQTLASEIAQENGGN